MQCNMQYNAMYNIMQWLCMLDTIGKMFEQVIEERLRKNFRGKRVLSANQYGF